MSKTQSRYLGEIAEEVNDRVGRRSVVSVYAVTKHTGFVPSSDYFKKRVHSSDISKYKRVKKGEFAYATIHLDEGSIGLLEDADEAAISPMYTVFKVDPSQVWQPFLLRLLKSPRMVARYQTLGTGTVHRRKSISFRRLAGLKLDLPEINEQKRIAGVLDKADAIRLKHQRSITLTDDLLLSTFLEMFGDPVTNPKGWPKRPLGDLSTIRRGASPRPISEFLGTYVPWIKIGDATGEDQLFISSTKEYVTSEGARRSVRLAPGSLVFSNSGSLGFARILRIEGCIHDGWLSIENLDESVGQIFLLKLLNSITGYFQQIAPEGTQKNLNTTIMKNFDVIVPPRGLQIQFESVVEASLRARSRQVAALKGSEELCSALSESAFRGDL